MRKAHIIVFFFLFWGSFIAEAQKARASKSPKQNIVATTEKEIKEFFESYAEDLRQHRREAIANRYHSRGYFRMGNGNKRLVSFEDTRRRYLTTWNGPKFFEWKDLSIEVLSSNNAVVVGLFDIQATTGEKLTFSYTGVLVKDSGQWRIRVEDESLSPLGYTTKTISGNSAVAGPYKYSLTAQSGASITAHRHSVDMHITVSRGRKFILMGELDTARVQVFDVGSTFVIPANTWHVEWWEEETVEEIEIIAPMRSERASPATPRKLK